MTRTNRLPCHCIASALALATLLLANALPAAPATSAPTTRGQSVRVTATPRTDAAAGHDLAFEPAAPAAADKTLRGAVALPLASIVSPLPHASPWTLDFTLRIDPATPAFAADAGKDILHVFDAPAFNSTTNARQTWGFSIRARRELILWNGNGKGGVSVKRTGLKIQPGAIHLLRVSMDPKQRRWSLSVQVAGDAKPAVFSGLGFRSPDSAPGGILMVATLHDPEPGDSAAPRPLRVQLGALRVTPGLLEPATSAASPESAGNFIRHAIFDTRGSGQLADTLFWHRMRDIDYLPPASVAPDPEHPRDDSASLRLQGGATLSIPVEVWQSLPKPPWTFSIWLKADRDATPARLAVETYRLHDRETHTSDIRAGRDWQRFEITVKDSHRNVRRQGRIQGPVNFRVTSASPDALLWVSSPQWEKSPAATPFRPSPRDEPRPADAFALLAAPPGSGFSPVSISSIPNRSGSVPLLARLPDDANPRRAAPLSLGVPFPAGEYDGTGPVSLTRAGAPDDAPAIPFQTEVLARWPGDGSVQSLGVIFEADMTPGENLWQLHYATAPAEQPATTVQNPASDSPIPNPQFSGHEAVIASDSGALWELIRDTASGKTVFTRATIEATGSDGAYYSSQYSPRVVTEIEQSGPVRVTVAKRGLLATQDGKHALLQFICRLHFWKHQPGPDIELTLVNSTTTNDTMALRDVALVTHAAGIDSATRVTLPWGEAPLGPNGLAALQSYQFSTGQWSRSLVRGHQLADTRPGERGLLWLALPTTPGLRTPDSEPNGKTVFLGIRNAWQQHPSMLAAGPDGRLAAYVWPAAPVSGLEWSPGLSITREFQIRLASAPSEVSDLKSQIGGADILVRVDPGWLAKTNIFPPLAPAAPEKLPFIEQRLSSPDGLLGQSPATIEAHHYYGLFDYGDAEGDGGWANLESYRDYAALLRGSRITNDDAIYRQGLASAAHYRDVDIQQVSGRTITHSVNHTIGGNDFGHAWPEGIMAHYLLTGSRRTREVVHQNLATMLALPPDARNVSYGRNLGFFLMTLSRAYQLTGDTRYRDRFLRQLDHAESVLAAAAAPGRPPELMQLTPQPRDGSLFYWPGSGYVPFAAWYGLEGLLLMHEFSPDAPALQARLRAHIEREYHQSTALEPTYRFHLEQLWPGLPAEQSHPIIATDYANGRGAFFYPVTTAYARLTGDTSWLHFARRALYANAMTNSERPENVLAAAVLPTGDELAAFDEAAFADETRDLLWRAAADTLPNGDFAKYAPYDEILAKSCGKGYKPRFATPWLYPLHWRLIQGKELTATELMKRRQTLATLDLDVFHAAAPAFRFDLDRGAPSARRINVTSAFFKIPAGRHTLSWWFREDAGAALAQCSLYLSDFDGNRPALDTNLSTTRDALVFRNGTTLRLLDSKLSKPDANGWRKARISFESPARYIASLSFNASLLPNHDRARLWLDDIALASP